MTSSLPMPTRVAGRFPLSRKSYSKSNWPDGICARNNCWAALQARSFFSADAGAEAMRPTPNARPIAKARPRRGRSATRAKRPRRVSAAGELEFAGNENKANRGSDEQAHAARLGNGNRVGQSGGGKAEGGDKTQSSDRGVMAHGRFSVLAIICDDSA